jgi:hypothetical protein
MNATTKTATKLTYKQWLDKVDDTMYRRIGLSVYDIDDYCYRDMYENGSTPAQAATAAIRYAKGLD